MLTRRMLFLSWGYLALQWLLAWAALAWRSGSSWWCQRKSCPSLCVRFVGIMCNYLKEKRKRETLCVWLWCSNDADTGLWQSSLSRLGDSTLVLVTQRAWKVIPSLHVIFFGSDKKIFLANWKNWLDIFNDKRGSLVIFAVIAFLDLDTTIKEFTSCLSSFL